MIDVEGWMLIEVFFGIGLLIVLMKNGSIVQKILDELKGWKR